MNRRNFISTITGVASFLGLDTIFKSSIKTGSSPINKDDIVWGQSNSKRAIKYKNKGSLEIKAFCRDTHATSHVFTRYSIHKVKDRRDIGAVMCRKVFKDLKSQGSNLQNLDFVVHNVFHPHHAYLMENFDIYM